MFQEEQRSEYVIVSAAAAYDVSCLHFQLVEELQDVIPARSMAHLKSEACERACLKCKYCSSKLANSFSFTGVCVLWQQPFKIWPKFKFCYSSRFVCVRLFAAKSNERTIT